MAFFAFGRGIDRLRGNLSGVCGATASRHATTGTMRRFRMASTSRKRPRQQRLAAASPHRPALHAPCRNSIHAGRVLDWLPPQWLPASHHDKASTIRNVQVGPNAWVKPRREAASA